MEGVLGHRDVLLGHVYLYTRSCLHINTDISTCVLGHLLGPVTNPRLQRLQCVPAPQTPALANLPVSESHDYPVISTALRAIFQFHRAQYIRS
jgi:hypothetical protein